MQVSLRPAKPSDQEYLETLNERCYREVVVSRFGEWNSALQHQFFQKKWIPSRYQIIVLGDAHIGALAVERRVDHVFLAELLIDPAHQKQGLGSEVVNQVLTDAANAGLPVRLQVLRKNRAL